MRFKPAGPSATSFLIHQIARAIIQEGIGNSSAGNWIVYHDEIEERFGINLSTDEKSRMMLRQELVNQKEILEAEVNDECSDVFLLDNYCEALDC